VTLPDVPADEAPPAAALELAGALDELDEPLLHAAAAKAVAVSIMPIAQRALFGALLIGKLHCFKTAFLIGRRQRPSLGGTLSRAESQRQ
jgi:hypothetical protein